MFNKYLQELGLKESICSCNTTIKDDSGRDWMFSEQRDTYGFDERETWSMDYTAAEWLYCHLKLYLETAEKIVDLTYHRFTVPVLDETNKSDDADLADRIFPIVQQEVTHKEAIDLCIGYLEAYLRTQDELCNHTFEEEREAYEKEQAAFRIFAEILPAMWW